MTKFDVKVKSTSITVYPGLEAMEPLAPLLNLLTYEDEFQEETKTLGYIYDESQDLLYLHKGVDIDYIQRLLVNAHIEYVKADDSISMRFEYDELVSPRNNEQVDVINFIAGLQQHKENENDRQIFLVKDPGFGKAEPYSRKIPTINGYTLMGELKVGDYVFNRLGHPTQVTDIFEQGIIDVYRITFNDNRIAICGKEHLWGVIVNDEEYKVITTGEMIDNWEPGKYKIPLCDEVHYPTREVPIDPYILGNIIALCDLNDEYFKIKNVNENNLMIAITIADELGYEIEYDETTCLFYDIDKQVKTRDALKDVISIVDNHIIPDDYMFNDINNRKLLLNGMNVDKESTNFDDTLSKQYIQLLNSFGHVIDDDITNEGKLTIKMIEYVGKEECRCIKVDNPEHLYLTEDYIVTHNTYCSGVGLCKYGVRTLIIMHRDSLRKQWFNSLYKMCGLNDDYVYEIRDSQDLYDIAYGYNDDLLKYDVYLMTHATFRAGLKRIGNLKDVGNVTKNLGIGLKIIDEAHLEFRDTLLMDAVFNVSRNLYLTATDGRSTKAENSIFRHVFANTTFYKPSTLLTSNQPSKWVEYYTVGLNTNAKQYIVKYRVEGGRGMNPATYGKWVIAYDKKQTHFKCCRDLLKIIYDRDPNAKVLLFMPLIDLCTDCSYFLTKSLNYDEDFQYDLTIRTINSKNTKNENEENKHADVIVTTIGSCGTGTDIPGITDIINCSPFVSHITAKQVFGRIRYCGKTCHFYDIYDQSVTMDKYWLKSRSRVLKMLALNYQQIFWTDDEVESS